MPSTVCVFAQACVEPRFVSRLDCPSMPEPIASRCRRIADSTRFQAVIFAVIVFNAVVLGLDTYDGIRDGAGGLLTVLNDACLGVFLVELAIRISAYGRRPQDFFREGWNVFDFVVITAAFVPGLRANATLLRVIRLLRVVRIVSVLPELRVLIRGMLGSLPPIGSMGVLAVLLIYVYGMLGWILFGDEDPERWGDIGDAMLTLFTVLTLEGWNDVLYAAQEIHSWSWVYFISFVLLASVLLINILIAIIINSMEDAREAEREEERRHLIEEAEEAGGTYDEQVETARRIAALKQAIEDLEDQLGIDTGPARPRSPKVTRRLGR
jgi:voltage-gated sodium channel